MFSTTFMDSDVWLAITSTKAHHSQGRRSRYSRPDSRRTTVSGITIQATPFNCLNAYSGAKGRQEAERAYSGNKRRLGGPRDRILALNGVYEASESVFDYTRFCKGVAMVTDRKHLPEVQRARWPR